MRVWREGRECSVIASAPIEPWQIAEYFFHVSYSSFGSIFFLCPYVRSFFGTCYKTRLEFWMCLGCIPPTERVILLDSLICVIGRGRINLSSSSLSSSKERRLLLPSFYFSRSQMNRCEIRSGSALRLFVRPLAACFF